jgi:halimadienyl-diphosphate synthase
LLPDHSGGIGHSPAATAAWLRQAEKQADLAEPCTVARRYLAKAAAATGVGIPGVVPNVWPITGFELSYAAYALLITDLLHQPALQDVIRPVLDELWIIMQRGHGVSFGEYFTPDVDETGVAMAALQAASYPVEPTVLMQFKHENHFCTFHHELNPSVFSNAHALYALAATGQRFPESENFLLERQTADGRWLADKWHSSWIYTTFEVSLTLGKLGYTKPIWKAATALADAQNADGGWGSGPCSSRLETCYAVIALSTLQCQGLLREEAKHSVQRGYQWLQDSHRRKPVAHEPLWLGKELYAPYRVDRVYELSTLISVALEKVLL